MSSALEEPRRRSRWRGKIASESMLRTGLTGGPSRFQLAEAVWLSKQLHHRNAAALTAASGGPLRLAEMAPLSHAESFGNIHIHPRGMASSAHKPAWAQLSGDFCNECGMVGHGAESCALKTRCGDVQSTSHGVVSADPQPLFHSARPPHGPARSPRRCCLGRRPRRCARGSIGSAGTARRVQACSSCASPGPWLYV